MDADGLRLGRFSCSTGVLFAAAVVLYFGCSPMLVFCLTAAFLHEMGHLLMCLLLRVPVYHLRLTLLGAELRLHSRSESGIEELLIALAGPLVNLTTACILVFAQHSEPVLLLAGASLILGVFNLLPISPLDGSRILHGIFSLWSLPMAERVTDILTGAGCIWLMVPGIFCAWKGNPSLLMVAIWLSLSSAVPSDAAGSWQSYPR